MLIREQKPNLVYEISPAAGYSSNYLPAALSKNDFGELHSFELLHKIYGRNTEEVIRSIISKKFNCELLKAESLISQNTLRAHRHRIYLQIAFCYKKLGLGNSHCTRNLYKSLAEALMQGANSRAKALLEIFKSTKRIHILLQFLSSKNQRKHTPVIRAFTFTLTVFFVVGIDRMLNRRSWRRHT